MTDIDTPVFSVQRFVDGQVPPLLASPGGLRTPEQATVFALEGYSFGDDGLESCGTFDAGRTPALVVLLDDDVAKKVFAQLNTYLGGRRAVQELAMDDREGMVAIWPESEGKRLLMVADSGNDCDSLPMQEAWEEIARVIGMGAYESGMVETHHLFDASRLQATDGVGQAIAALLPTPAPRSPSL